MRKKDIDKTKWREPRRNELKLYVDQTIKVLNQFPKDADLGFFFRAFFMHEIFGETIRKEGESKTDFAIDLILDNWCDDSDYRLDEYRKTCEKNKDNRNRGKIKAELIEKYHIKKFDEEHGQHIFESSEDQVYFMEDYEKGLFPEWVSFDYEFRFG